MFFGFNGRTSDSNGQLRGLGIIGYDALCVEKFKSDLGDKFTWRRMEDEEEDEEVEEGK